MTQFRSIVARFLTPFGLGLILAAGFSVSAWNSAPPNPPASNVTAPINISDTFQYKDGGLLLNQAGTFVNGLIIQSGRVGIGVLAPTEQLEISGNLALPATTATVGAIKQGGTPILHTYGSENIFVGPNAGNFTMTGGGNTGSGSQSLYANTTGIYNTANGGKSLRANTTGNFNTATGYWSLFNNLTGSYNTANGFDALYYTTGDNNTANGAEALKENTTGYENTATGRSALKSNSTGYYNTANGRGALLFNGTGFSNTAVGTFALNNNINGNNNTANGFNSLYANTGSNNTAVGYQSLQANTTGSNNTALGYGADVSVANLTNATAIGNGAIVTGPNKVRIGNGAVLEIGGAVGWSNLSDRRLKKDITDYTHGLDLITRLHPVEYTLISDPTNKVRSGFIAQDVEATGVPFYGLNRPQNAGDYYSLDYAQFVVPLVNSVKELKAENDQLKADMDALHARVEKLEAK